MFPIFAVDWGLNEPKICDPPRSSSTPTFRGGLEAFCGRLEFSMGLVPRVEASTIWPLATMNMEVERGPS